MPNEEYLLPRDTFLYQTGTVFPHYRYASRRQADVSPDEDSNDEKEYLVIFSTESAVERSWGIEILDHSPESVRLERLRTTGVMHIDHDASVTSSIGGVKEAWIADRQGLAIVRPSEREEAAAFWRDVDQGILRNVSVGYRIFAIEKEPLEKPPDGKSTYRVMDWEPFEISLITVPADVSATIEAGRGLTQSIQEIPMSTENIPEFDASAENPNDASSSNRDIPAVDPGDANQILTLARYMEERIPGVGCMEIADDFVAFGRSFDAFKAEAWKLFSTAREASRKMSPIAHPSDLGMSAGEVRSYSLFRAIRASLSGDWKPAGLELEASREIAERLGREPRGFFVPIDVQRVMTAGGAGTGAELVPEDHRGDLFIDALRTRSVVLNMGASMLAGLQGNVAIPKLSASADFYWVAEDADITDSTPSTSVVTLTPKTIGGAVPMSRRLLIQSDPSVEAVIRNDLIAGVSLAVDLAALEGTGANNQPLGVSGQPDVGTVSIGTPGQPTWAELVAFETAVDAADALDGDLAYITTPAVVGHCKSTPKDAGSGIFLMQGTEINGYLAKRRTGLSQHAIYFGNIRDILVGMWGILDVRADEATKAASGGLVLRVFVDADIAVRHGKSFAKNTI